MQKRFVPALVLGTLMALSAGPAGAVIMYQVTNLGGNQWEYSYHVDGPFDPNAGFTLLYGPTDYANVAVSDGLDPAAWLESLIPGGGVVDTVLTYTALSAIPAGGADFKVSFDWLGNGDPGSQPYDLFDSSGTNINQSPLSTIPAGTSVPEPASLMLVLVGMFLLLLRGFRYSGVRTPVPLPRSRS